MGAKANKKVEKPLDKDAVVGRFAKAYLKGEVKNAQYYDVENPFFTFTLDVAYKTRNDKTAHAYLRCMADDEVLDDISDGDVLNGVFNVMTGTYKDKQGVTHYTTTFNLQEVNGVNEDK